MRHDAYLLQNHVSHSRFLPEQSAHAFVYPSISLLLSLRSLESGNLDLWKGWLFGYGSVGWRVTGLRPTAYLDDADNHRDPAQHLSSGLRPSISNKLRNILFERDFDPDELDDAWIMTMPSYMGFEGINPLTVYYCYNSNSELYLVILEIHNTFGERHIHVLQPGVNEDTIRINRFHHTWTFPRQFHVSPFNDRSGFYRVSITRPSHAPDKASMTVPTPRVKVVLLTADATPQVKLVATLVSHTALRFTPATLVSTLFAYPISLFLSFPRILYQAFVLHYSKGLKVYARPEPTASSWEIESKLGQSRNPVQPSHWSDMQDRDGRGNKLTGSIGWQSETWLDAWARRTIERFLERRCRRLGIRVRLISTNPHCPKQIFPREVGQDVERKDDPTSSSSSANTLDIYYRTPRVFSIFILSPSAEHALLLGDRAERLFRASSSELFTKLFSTSPSPPVNPNAVCRTLQGIRKRFISPSVSLLTPQYRHPLHEELRSFWELMSLFTLTILLYAVQKLEKAIFITLRAKFAHGDEPWNPWQHIGIEDEKMAMTPEGK